MRIGWLAVAALLGAATVAAQDDAGSATDFAALSDAELQERYDAAQEDGIGESCGNVPLLAELTRRKPDTAEFRRNYSLVQAFCATYRDEYAEGLEHLERTEREHGARGFDMLGLFLAARLEDGGKALARLERMAEAGTLSRIPPENLFAAIRAIRKDGRDDELGEFAFRYSASSHFARTPPEVQTAFGYAALQHSAQSGDLSRVDHLLGSIRNPTSYLSMLASREFEAAWPLIERHAGDNLAGVTARYVDWTRARLAENPEDRDRFSEAAHALHFAGRFEEAAALARDWREGRGGTEGIEEGDAWAMNIEAYALDALGRRAEADAVFDRLAGLPADEHPWVVNFVINRASRLVGQERWQEGLLASELSAAVAREHGSVYANMLVARDRTCALHALGRGGESEAELEYLVAHFDDAAHVATTGLLCAGEKREAERRLGRALQDEAARSILLEEMQDSRFELFYTPSQLPRARDLILANARLRADALKHVRLLPERLVPAANARRAVTAL